MKIGVVADDLTGALDTGLEFWKKGMRTIIATSARSLKGYVGEADVMVVDTASRTSVPRRARDRVLKATRALREVDAKCFYKKLDSTLRGNIGAEVEAMLTELRIEATILSPALPEQGRTIVNGCLFVNGRRLDKTPFSRDPLNPIRQSHVPSLIGAQTHKHVGWITLTAVRGDLKAAIEAQMGSGANIIVADAVTRGDLGRIAMTAAKAGLGKLMCGSAGLAAELPYALGICQRPLPAVVVSGSLHPVTRVQISKLIEILSPHITPLSPSVLCGRHARGNLTQELDKALQAITDGLDVLVYLRSGTRVKLSGLKAEKALASLHRAIERLVEARRISGLVLVGGETAAQACRSLGAKTVDIEDEPSPGLACARITDGENKGLRIVTKAGGFGAEDALVRAVNFLKVRRP
jgi:uncharacterized protein YgbK (DUF1537 family)